MPASERPALFQKKLQECCEVYDFRSDDKPEAKEMKRQVLLELIDFINLKKSLTEAVYKDVLDMVRHINISAWFA